MRHLINCDEPRKVNLPLVEPTNVFKDILAFAKS